MLLRVIDFETTGMPPGAAVCEVGWCNVIETAAGSWSYHSPISMLTDPGRTMPPEARAIHHISDFDCEGAARISDAFMTLADGADVFVAHNAAFEREFFGGGNKPWICTLKVAHRLWPECPSHSNQCLRYFLGIELDDDVAMPPHRAGPDAYVTAALLVAALERATVDEMVEWTKKPSLLPRVTFGKHKDREWADLPSDYLDWIVRKSDMNVDTKYTAKHWLARKGER